MSMCTAYTQSSACTMIFFAYLSYSCLFLHIHHVHIAYTQSSACTFFFFWYVFNIFMLIIVYSSYTYALHMFRVVPVCCSFGLFIILMFIIAYLSYPHSLHTLNLVPAPCAFFLASFWLFFKYGIFGIYDYYCINTCADSLHAVVYCSVSQCVAVCSSVLQSINQNLLLPANMLQRVLQCVAVCCSVLQCVAVCCRVLVNTFGCLPIYCSVCCIEL